MLCFLPEIGKCSNLPVLSPGMRDLCINAWRRKYDEENVHVAQKQEEFQGDKEKYGIL